MRYKYLYTVCDDWLVIVSDLRCKTIAVIWGFFIKISVVPTLSFGCDQRFLKISYKIMKTSCKIA